MVFSLVNGSEQKQRQEISEFIKFMRCHDVILASLHGLVLAVLRPRVFRASLPYHLLLCRSIGIHHVQLVLKEIQWRENYCQRNLVGSKIPTISHSMVWCIQFVKLCLPQATRKRIRNHNRMTVCSLCCHCREQPLVPLQAIFAWGRWRTGRY